MKLNVLSLCDGMACGAIAFKELGIDVNYYAVEIDKYPRILADANIPNILRPTDDVTLITEEMIAKLPIFDWVIFGSSCQSLSIAGDGTGLEGESKVFFDCMNVLRWCQKRNPDLKYLIENVASMRKKHKDQMSAIIGHDPTLVDSALLSAQSRKRLYWTNFPVSQPLDKNIKLSDIITTGEFAVAWSKSARSDGSFDERLRTDGKANNLTASGINGTEARTLITKKYIGDFKPRKVFNRKDLLVYNVEHRLLTVAEASKLQTIPTWYNMNVVSKSQALKILGNGWTVEVIKHIILLTNNKNCGRLKEKDET